MQQTPKNSKLIFITALMLAAFSLIASVMIVVTYKSTASVIKENQHKFLMQSLSAVMPLSEYDNDLISDSFFVNHSLLSQDDSLIYPAFKNDQAKGAIITAIAPNGYNGKIKVIVGLNYSGEIHAVRVVEHKETPGLGDPIERKRSNWIEQFSKQSLNSPLQEDWLVKKDGGDFDQLTGATITPRAVVSAVKNSLLFYKEQREQIFSHKHKGQTNE